MSTTRLDLPEIVQYQAQKEVTHNQALWMLDCLVMASVIDRATTPPANPSDGDAYLVTATATDDWAGHEDEIAHYFSNAWHYYSPGEGWQVYVQDEDGWYVYDGASWVAKDVTQPAGNDKSIQFNDNGSFAGSDDLTWDNTNKRLALTGNFKISADGKIIWEDASAADAYLSEMRVTGDLYPRYRLRADGQIELGSGAAAPDCELKRRDTDILNTPDRLEVGSLGVSNSEAGNTPGNVVKKIEVFDDAGNSLGYLAVYDSIS